jgi:hypothetical protein
MLMFRARLQGFRKARLPARPGRRFHKPKLKALLHAGRRVVARWERGDLAGAVRDLEDALRRFKQ